MTILSRVSLAAVKDHGVEATEDDVQISRRSMRRFKRLADQADTGATINVTTMSDEEILALIRR